MSPDQGNASLTHFLTLKHMLSISDKDMFINMRQFLATLWTFELLLDFDQLLSSNLQNRD